MFEIIYVPRNLAYDLAIERKYVIPPGKYTCSFCKVEVDKDSYEICLLCNNWYDVCDNCDNPFGVKLCHTDHRYPVTLDTVREKLKDILEERKKLTLAIGQTYSGRMTTLENLENPSNFMRETYYCKSEEKMVMVDFPDIRPFSKLKELGYKFWLSSEEIFEEEFITLIIDNTELYETVDSLGEYLKRGGKDFSRETLIRENLIIPKGREWFAMNREIYHLVGDRIRDGTLKEFIDEETYNKANPL